MHDPFFFGYGSLVNRRTHDYAHAHPARARGWRRAWRYSPVRPVSFLTVLRSEADEILGLIAEVPQADWAALDERERAYERQTVTQAVVHPLDHDPEIAIFAIAEGQHHPPGDNNPVLMSYLDTVVQGFLAEFGEDGVAHFFNTTDGWDEAPFLDDRAEPIYRRHQPASEAERAMVDDWLAQMGARVIRA